MQDGKLKLTLNEAPLDDQLDFHALSYVWGDHTDKKTIVVNDQLLEITQNLYDFLDTARKHEPSFCSHHQYPDYLKSYTSETNEAVDESSGSNPIDFTTTPVHWWIDAICINQNDEDEKSIQVTRMRDIYSMATRVWVWIGLPSTVFGLNSNYSELRQALTFHMKDNTQYLTQEGGEKAPTSLFQQFTTYQRQMILERSIARMREMGFPIQPGPMMDMMYQKYAQIAGQLPPEIASSGFNNFLGQLAALLKQPYFERTWIIQEYVLNPREPIALLGNFVFNLGHTANMGMRLAQESSEINNYMKTHAFSVYSRLGNLMTIAEARKRWHNLPSDGFKLSPYSSEIDHFVSQPEKFFSHLPPGGKLDHLLHIFDTRQCTNPLDYFYSILGFFGHDELPESLLPDYSLPVTRVAQDYTKYIIESTGNLRIIESSQGFGLADCPSWVPNVKYLTSKLSDESKFSEGNKPFFFSNKGQHLTLEGTLIGEVLSCSCAACPTEFTDQHLEFVQDVLIEGAAQITGKPMAEVFMSWLEDQLDAHLMLPSDLGNITSMRDLLQRYHDVCSDIPSEVITALNGMRNSDLRIIFDIPCRDPACLYILLRLAKQRYCLLSTGHIMLCGKKDTENTSNLSHRWDDCAWALKGLHQLAMLRPKDGGYEYCGLVTSSKFLLESVRGREATHDLYLNDDFFATKKTVQVTLV